MIVAWKHTLQSDHQIRRTPGQQSVIPQGVGYSTPPGGDDALIRTHDNRLNAVQAYLAAGSFADAMVGLILDALDQSPYADNTIVVLWSDHGWSLGEKQHWRKHALWRQTTRSLLLFRLPGGENGVCPWAVSLLDIYPTLAALVDGDPPAFLEGNDLGLLLDNPTAEWTSTGFMFFFSRPSLHLS